MKTINRLIPDIYEIVQNKKGWFDEAISSQLQSGMGFRLQEHFNTERYGNGKKVALRLSAMGSRCPCALWYSIHHPECGEALPPWAEVKFAFGHILEALVISLAKAAGHEVTGEQDEVELDGVIGHRDCVIDGCTVDVKSAASRSFEKFKNKSIAINDPFGYLDQLDGYVVASLQDPLVRVKDKGYLLAIDKQLGHMCLYEHTIREQSIRDRIGEYKRIVGLPAPPPCTCGTQPDGQSGNIRLDMQASYNPYKFCCFPHLRVFIYSQGPGKSGPVYLTKVVRKPDVKEVDKTGKIIYN